MIAEIIPAIRLPRNLGLFSYNVSEDLEQDIKIGQVAQINFRNKNISGLIIKIKKNNKYNKKLKNINKILYNSLLITKNQINLIQKISEYYAVSQAIVAKSFLPDIPKKNINKIKNFKINKKNKHTKKLFWWSSLDERNKKYIEIIKKSKNKQILILVPEIEMISKLIKNLKLNNNKNIFKMHSRLTSKIDYFKNYLDILSGKPKIIIGTKISIILPFTNLGAIIIDDENNWNHKQSDINPRFDARIVAEWIAQQHKAELTLATPAPSLEAYNQFHTDFSLGLQTGFPPDGRAGSQGQEETSSKEGLNNNIKIINLKQERDKGNYSVLSDNLLSNIEIAMRNKEQVFLLHNRKGMAGFIDCDDCRYIFKCPECDVLLVYYNQTKKMHCHHCGIKVDIPPLCPKCAGPNIKFKSKGIEDIAIKIKKLFPDKNIISISKENNILNNKADIIIGTEFALAKIDFSKINLIAFINFDQLLNIPDFRTTEKAYQKVFELITKNNNINLLIQTYNEDNIILKSLKQNNPEIFYKQELEMRKQFNYPPFTKLVKIIFQDKSNSRAFYLSGLLVKKIKDLKLNLEILGPLPAYPRKVRGKFRYNIIIKIKLARHSLGDGGNKNLNKLYNIIPQDFIIDVDPGKLV